MIVVDTNTIAYLYLNSTFTPQVEQLLLQDQQWLAPLIWRSEFRNVLASYMKAKLIDLPNALLIQQKAELLLADNEFAVDSLNVLTLASESGCSAYDCEFVYLAQYFHCPLITADKKLLSKFPETAKTAKRFLRA